MTSPESSHPSENAAAVASASSQYPTHAAFVLIHSRPSPPISAGSPSSVRIASEIPGTTCPIEPTLMRVGGLTGDEADLRQAVRLVDREPAELGELTLELGRDLVSGGAAEP